MHSRPIRMVFLIAGWLSLVLGFIGAFLPILPTTPFVILAAFCFSRGSEAWHQWLLNSRLFGKMIRDWESHGVIRPRAKAFATTMIGISLGFIFAFVQVKWLVKGTVALICGTVLVFIWTRPSRPKGAEFEDKP